jgi:hypothetical protein
MISEWRGALHFLAGFEVDKGSGSGTHFNFVLSNGARSEHRDGLKYWTHMLPKRKIIKSVDVYFSDYIHGFRFFDKEGKTLWEIGMIHSSMDMEVETVILEDDEVIIGVVGKLHPGYQSIYTDL